MAIAIASVVGIAAALINRPKNSASHPIQDPGNANNSAAAAVVIVYVKTIPMREQGLPNAIAANTIPQITEACAQNDHTVE